MLTKKNNSSVVNLQGITFRTNLPLENSVKKICFLLHGWNGNENSMQIFFPDLPQDMGIIAPRALFPTNEGGFTWARSLTAWTTIQESKRSSLPELLDSVARINDAIDYWLNYFNIQPQEMVLGGFSQGGALALLLGLSFPKKFTRVACMSGYLPEAFDLTPLKNQIPLPNKFLVTHGTKDDIIPIEHAALTVKSLMSAGLNVDYCEDQVSHKIGLSCRKKLTEFYLD